MSDRKKHVLITGGAGFIGAHLALELLVKGYEVTVYDNLLAQIHGKNPERDSFLYAKIKDKVHFIKGDIADKEALIQAIKNKDMLIHLAAETGTGQSMYEIERYVQVNSGGTAILLDILANHSHQVKKMVIASSRAVYGEGKYRTAEGSIVYPGHRDPARMDKGDFDVYHESHRLYPLATDEETPAKPLSVYGLTKYNQEQLIMTVCPKIGIDAVSLRFQNVYGPGQSLKNPYTGILSIFSTLILTGQSLNIFEDGEESRDFVYIDDVVAAIILAMEQRKANNQVYNVGTGMGTSVLEIARKLMFQFGVEVSAQISGSYRLGDIRHNFADITKIQQHLGFHAKWTLDEGLGRFANWVNTQQIPQNGFDQSLEEMKKKGLLKVKADEA